MASSSAAWAGVEGEGAQCEGAGGRGVGKAGTSARLQTRGSGAGEPRSPRTRRATVADAVALQQELCQRRASAVHGRPDALGELERSDVGEHIVLQLDGMDECMDWWMTVV